MSNSFYQKEQTRNFGNIISNITKYPIKDAKLHKFSKQPTLAKPAARIHKNKIPLKDSPNKKESQEDENSSDISNSTIMRKLPQHELIHSKMYFECRDKQKDSLCSSNTYKESSFRRGSSQLDNPLIKQSKRRDLKSQKYLSEFDSANKQDIQFVHEYISDIYSNYILSQHVNIPPIGFLKTQSCINEKMRSILVDWIIEIHYKFNLIEETLFLSVNILDRFLSKKQVGKKMLQMLACACILISSKYEEIYPPECRDFIYISENSFSVDDLKRLESDVLITLEYELIHVSALQFLNRLYLVSSKNKNPVLLLDKHKSTRENPTEDEKIYFLSLYLLEMTLLDYSMLGFSNLNKSCACLLLARLIMEIKPPWTEELNYHTSLDYQSLELIVNKIKALSLKMNFSNLSSLKSKFNSRSFLSISIFYHKFLERRS